MVEHDDLGGEVRDTAGGLVLGVGGDVATLDVLHGHILDVEADVVAGDGLGQGRPRAETRGASRQTRPQCRRPRGQR